MHSRHESCSSSSDAVRWFTMQRCIPKAGNTYISMQHELHACAHPGMLSAPVFVAEACERASVANGTCGLGLSKLTEMLHAEPKKSETWNADWLGDHPCTYCR